ncbi:EI24 domain-containing protein [Phaeovibrio sulfidiphilus]|uniref:EI24 domain-containing protein n=1 Tax=Phaeovibrio sulfidiphilus TaxID=1220600 RepID=A0A8J6YY90_9PROT|nr:EI24 domain-containing protein [Phaeovibrio sulfidiphilus]MBE1237887.1 EI24 domain-containing protein [Phaeovibrio sulfidiphilus]
MFRDFIRAFSQLLSDRELRRPLVRSALLSVVGIVLLSVGLAALLPWLVSGASALFGLESLQEGYQRWDGVVNGVVGTGTAVILSVLFFPTLCVSVAGFFLDPVSRAVEARWYPDLPAPRDAGVVEPLVRSVRFGLVSLGLNLLLLPVYLLLGLAGIGVLVFWAVNAWLLSREYFEQAAFRRVSPGVADRVREQNARALWVEGLGLAFLASIPVVNLVTPVIGTAVFTHFVQRKGLFKS